MTNSELIALVDRLRRDPLKRSGWSSKRIVMSRRSSGIFLGFSEFRLPGRQDTWLSGVWH